jgi:magnesium chelatase accessory protein
MADKPDWRNDGRDWPNAGASRFLSVGGLDWHVQVAGEGPDLLLLHGAGAATHSWRDLIPLLATQFRVIAPDLPGHGFTGTPHEALSLPNMARRTAAVLRALEARPALLVGHSAGAAVALRLALDGAAPGAGVVGINAALKPFAGAAAPLFRTLALGLFANPLAIGVFSAAARDAARVKRLIEGTGSHLDARGIELYGRLFRRRGHVSATLGMMGAWDVQALLDDLPRLEGRLTLIVGDRDLAVPPAVSRGVAASRPGTEVVSLAGVGHLAHEEAPDAVAEILARLARQERAS